MVVCIGRSMLKDGVNLDNYVSIVGQKTGKGALFYL